MIRNTVAVLAVFLAAHSAMADQTAQGDPVKAQGDANLQGEAQSGVGFGVGLGGGVVLKKNSLQVGSSNVDAPELSIHGSVVLGSTAIFNPVPNASFDANASFSIKKFDASEGHTSNLSDLRALAGVGFDRDVALGIIGLGKGYAGIEQRSDIRFPNHDLKVEFGGRVEAGGESSLGAALPFLVVTGNAGMDLCGRLASTPKHWMCLNVDGKLSAGALQAAASGDTGLRYEFRAVDDHSVLKSFGVGINGSAESLADLRGYRAAGRFDFVSASAQFQ